VAVHDCGAATAAFGRMGCDGRRRCRHQRVMLVSISVVDDDLIYTVPGRLGYDLWTSATWGLHCDYSVGERATVITHIALVLHQHPASSLPRPGSSRTRPSFGFGLRFECV